MKLEVCFRQYTNPYIDEETGEKERGEYVGSFSEVVEGKNPEDIAEKASQRAEELSRELDSDVRVWEIPLPVR